jgi:hypothetical protein
MRLKRAFFGAALIAASLILLAGHLSAADDYTLQQFHEAFDDEDAMYNTMDAPRAAAFYNKQSEQKMTAASVNALFYDYAKGKCYPKCRCNAYGGWWNEKQATTWGNYYLQWTMTHGPSLTTKYQTMKDLFDQHNYWMYTEAMTIYYKQNPTQAEINQGMAWVQLAVGNRTSFVTASTDFSTAYSACQADRTGMDTIPK